MSAKESHTAAASSDGGVARAGDTKGQSTTQFKPHESGHKHARYIFTPPDKFTEPYLSSHEIGSKAKETTPKIGEFHRQGTQITHFQEAMVSLTKGGNAFLRK